MIHHYMTKYTEQGRRYVEAWIQLDVFGLRWCFSRRKRELSD